MIQTHYVRLEPPYEVIFCNGEVGVQIGSLIAVEEKRGKNDEYGLVAHTHPIVSYGSKQKLSLETNGKSIWTNPGDYVQGAVWDKVEVNDVLVLGVLDEEKQWSLSENYFAQLVYRTLEAKIQQREPIQYAIYHLHRNLSMIGIAPHFTNHPEMKLTVDIEDYLNVPFVSIVSDDEVIQLAIPLDEEEKMVNQAQNLLRTYIQTLFGMPSGLHWTFGLDFANINDMAYDDGTPFAESDIPVVNLVKRLNQLYSGNK